MIDDDIINIENANEETHTNDCDNLQFKTQKIHFFPSDIEKMKTMTLKEEIEYMRKLKAEERYTIEFSEDPE